MGAAFKGGLQAMDQGRWRIELAACLLWLGCHGAVPDLPPEGSAAAQLHARATVADLHADPTLWNGDLLTGEGRQAAVPQLRAGQVDVVVFGIPTQGLPIIGGWRIFTWWRGFPPEARRDPWEAALHQINSIHAAAARSSGAMVLAHDAAGLRAARTRGALAAFIGLEGAHALGGDPSRVATLKQKGVFYVGLVHLSDDDLGGSNFKLGPAGRRGPLTEQGLAMLKAMEDAGLVLDLAHTSRATFDQALAAFRGPVMISHTGVSAVHPHWRNVDDDQLRAVAARGGVVGIMFGNHYLGGSSISDWVDHVQHTVQVIGAEHVALGSDFDGMVPLPDGITTAADLPRLSAALLERGLSEREVELIMGGSFEAMLERIATP